MTFFAFTPPITHLSDFAHMSDFTFGLSFLLENQTYRNFIERQDSVVMDNSFNETQIPATVEQVIALYAQTNSEVVVQPDADDWTSEQMLDAWRAVADEIGPDNVMGIFRNEKERSALLRAGAQSTALSYWWRTWSGNFSNTHFLGLGNLSSLGMRPYSMDTTIPIKMAIRGESILDWDGVYRKPEPSAFRSENRLQRAWEYFNTVMTDAQLELAFENIYHLKAWAARGVPVQLNSGTGNVG